MSTVPDPDPVLLRYPHGSALLVAGVPGAGKSTLVARAAAGSDDVRVLDTDPLRARWAQALQPLPYPLWRPLLHAFHLTRVWWLIGRPGALVVVEPGTRGFVRRAFVRRADRAGRELHLLGIDASFAEARAGQVARRRTIGRASLGRHAARWSSTLDEAREEGFASVRVITRAQAAQVDGLLVPASSPAWSSRRRSLWSPVARLASGVRWR